MSIGAGVANEVQFVGGGYLTEVSLCNNSFDQDRAAIFILNCFRLSGVRARPY